MTEATRRRQWVNKEEGLESVEREREPETRVVEGNIDAGVPSTAIPTSLCCH